MSKEILENILSYMAYERGHSAGEEEVEAIKRGMVADFKPVFKRIEELERERNTLLEELSKIAQIAHAGGFAVVEIMDALVEIRKATIPYWEKSNDHA